MIIIQTLVQRNQDTTLYAKCVQNNNEFHERIGGETRR